MNSNFSKASTLERQKMTTLFTKRNVKYYLFTDEEDYDQWDGLFIKNDKTRVFEVKNRYIKSDRYPSTMIEQSKYDFLMNQEIGEPWVFIFFEDNKVFIHKLSKDNEYQFTTEVCPYKTMGDNKMVLKDVVYITMDPKQIYSFKA